MKKLLVIIAVVADMLVLMFIITSIWIGQDVNKQCKIAQVRHQGDCIEVLMKYLQDDKNDFKSRNSAIWALGQLGDKRALPILEKYYTGNIPKKESLDKGISQYELQKAIKLANGGFNITRFIWKN